MIKDYSSFYDECIGEKKKTQHLNALRTKCCSEHTLKCFLHLPFPFAVNDYVALFLPWGINILSLRTVSLTVKGKKCVSCPERVIAVREEGMQWSSLPARNRGLLLSIPALFNIHYCYKREGQFVSFLWIVVLLLCCTELWMKQYRWTLQNVTFFYFTFCGHLDPLSNQG